MMYKFIIPMTKQRLVKLEGLGFSSNLGEISICTVNTGDAYDRTLEAVVKMCLTELNYNIASRTKFTQLVLISDRNKLDDEIFINIERTCKKIILGRLANYLTTCYDKCTWFDVQLVIMKSLGIEYHENCTEDFIFKAEDARYNGA